MITLKNIPINKEWIDYSSLAMFWKCPRAYYWRIVKELTTTGEKAALINGTAYHEAKATFYHAKLVGKPFDECVDLALKSMIPIMAEIKSEDKKRNITVALSTMNSYFDYWRNEPYEIVAAEIPFAVDLINFLYVGKIDAFKKHEAFGNLVQETKTTSIVGDRWAERGNPNAQVDGYVAGYYISTGVMPDGAILDIIPVTEKCDKKPFRFITTRTLSDVEDWMSNIQEWWFTLQRYKETGIFPMNTESCVPLLGFKCDYTILCSMYKHPYKIDHLEIPAEYKVEPWAPYEGLEKEVKI
mgnify:FL=1